jgi:uncharacterized protein YndB with AHSA1/START domain
MNHLPHRLERTILIRARQSTVFRFFTDGARWASWWGTGSRIDARAGGKVLVVYPGGVEVAGEVVEIVAPEHIVFTYGYASGTPFGVGESRVTIRLEPVSTGTRLHLLHEFAEPSTRDQHVQGWRYQLSLFANVVMNESKPRAEEAIGAWFAAWSNENAKERRTILEPWVSPDVRFADRFGLVHGIDELFIHLTAVHAFMPGTRLVRDGEILHCQGKAIATWSASPAGGHREARGSNVFVFDCDGRIEDVTGFWAP